MPSSSSAIPTPLRQSSRLGTSLYIGKSCGGLVGALLTGIFVSPVFQGVGTEKSIAEQFMVQAVGAGATIVYCVIVTYVILKVVDAMVGLRVDPADEDQGLDIGQHDERGYSL